jgi:hypothetical protein
MAQPGDECLATDEEGPMKAVIYDAYGSPDVLEVTEIGQPEARDELCPVRMRLR